MWEPNKLSEICNERMVDEVMGHLNEDDMMGEELCKNVMDDLTHLSSGEREDTDSRSRIDLGAVLHIISLSLALALITSHILFHFHYY